MDREVASAGMESFKIEKLVFALKLGVRVWIQRGSLRMTGQ